MKKFTLYILIIVYFILFPVYLNAQINDKVNNEVKSLIFNLESAKVDSVLQKVNQQPLKEYLHLYQNFVSCIVENSLGFKEYCTIYNNQIEFLKSESKSKPFVLHFLSELYLQRGILEYQNENTFTAINYFSKAYSFWMHSEELIPDSKYNLKLSGIFNLLIGNLPKPYSNMVGWFGYNGNTKRGFEDLRAYLNCQDDRFGNYYEALLYLGFSYLKFEKNESTIENFIKDYSSSKLPEFIQSIMVRCANKIHQPDLCSELFNKPSILPVLSYLKGKYHVQRGSDTALVYLNSFLKKEKSMQFKADAYRYMSWHYLFRGESALYLNYQDSIKALSAYPTSEDKQAKYETELNLQPDPLLLKSRLLFDSGMFQDAALVLENNSSLFTGNSQLEYHYRLGRCYHYLKDTTKALLEYSIAIDLANDNNRYFGPYAALYAAAICLDSNDLSQFNYFLDKASELNNGEYANSIRLDIDRLKEACTQIQ